jgi:outer membrane protein OmpA-like peptidoglycan-associated protein
MRRTLSLALAVVATAVFSGAAFAQQAAPTARSIERSLGAAPQVYIKPTDRITRKEITKRYDLRQKAPYVDIQAINFAFGSAEIPHSERPKVEQIAIALNSILRRNSQEVVLIEGHTDAVGSRWNNQALSERRAASLKRALVQYYGVPSYALDTVGFGEDYLLINTPYEEWRNRRVTLRRITDFVRY